VSLDEHPPLAVDESAASKPEHNVDSSPAPAPRGLPEQVVLVGSFVVAVACALALAALLMAVTGGDAGSAFSAMVQGSVGSAASIVATLNHAAILLTVAVGAAIAGRAGLINIGQEGQLAIGAMAGTAVGLHFHGPGWIVIVAVLVASAIGGALWAGIAAVLKYWRNVNETISTLLLIFVAEQLVSLAVNRSWLLQEHLANGGVSATGGVISASPQSDSLPTATRLPSVLAGPTYRLSLAIVIAVVLAAVAVVVVSRTRLGLRLQVFGMSPRVARRFGITAAVFGTGALLVSGATAGMAGGLLLTATKYRLESGFAANYGWDGLLVALVAAYRPGVAIAVAVLFGALRAGGGVLASTGVSSAIVGIIQALVVLAALVPGVVARRRPRAAARGAGT
jgi:simple sugar transport system permease protein